MDNKMAIAAAGPGDREEVLELLKSAGLPTEDVTGDLSNFLIASVNNYIVGAIGLEIYGHDGLLRSLATRKEYRKMGIAANLILHLEQMAGNLGITQLLLLTETAPDYFINKGYVKISRNEAPESLKHSTEFSHICPGSAILMKKRLTV